MEKNCLIHISYIYTLNKKWSPAEFEDMSEISASMPTPNITYIYYLYLCLQYVSEDLQYVSRDKISSWKFCLRKHMVVLQRHITGINIGNEYR